MDHTTEQHNRYRAAYNRLQLQLAQFIACFINVLIPAITQVVRQYHMKEPYHTSILSGQGWVEELLHGHPNRIRTELGVSKEVFNALIFKLREMGHSETKYVSLEEQLAIFLYACVTGLTVRHLGERFQRSNATISKYVQFIGDYKP
jgi:hypothetical protein